MVISSRFRSWCSAVCLLSVLAGTETVRGAISGFTVLEPRTNAVQSGVIFSITFLQGTYTNVGGLTSTFKVGNGGSDTNYIYPTGLIDFYTNGSNQITNGFYSGMTLNPSFSQLSNIGNGTFQVDLTLTGGSTGMNTNNVFTVFFQAFNDTTNDLQISVVERSATLTKPSSGTWSSSGGTWALTNSVFNPTTSSLVIIKAIPEPSTALLCLLFLGIGGAICQFRKYQT